MPIAGAADPAPAHRGGRALGFARVLPRRPALARRADAASRRAPCGDWSTAVRSLTRPANEEQARLGRPSAGDGDRRAPRGPAPGAQGRHDPDLRHRRLHGHERAGRPRGRRPSAGGVLGARSPGDRVARRHGGEVHRRRRRRRLRCAGRPRGRPRARRACRPAPHRGSGGHDAPRRFAPAGAHRHQHRRGAGAPRRRPCLRPRLPDRRRRQRRGAAAGSRAARRRRRRCPHP